MLSPIRNYVCAPTIVLVVVGGFALAPWLFIQIVELGDPPFSDNDRIELSLIVTSAIASLGAMFTQGAYIFFGDHQTRPSRFQGLKIIAVMITFFLLSALFWHIAG